MRATPPALQAELHRLRGTIERRAGRAERAIGSYEHALGLVGELAVPRAVILISLGYAQLTDWRLAEASITFHAAQELLERHGQRRYRAKLVTNFGQLRFAVGDFGQARELFDRAIALHREDQDLDGFADTLALCARALVHEGELDAAGQRLEEAEALARRSRGAYDRAHTSAARAELEQASGRPEAALRASIDAREAARTAHLVTFEFLALSQQAALHAALGNADSAPVAAEAALSMYRSGTWLE